MATPVDSVHYTGTNYEGRFGQLCKYIPFLDASAPDGWVVMKRSFEGTIWLHLETDITIHCQKSADGWNVTLVDNHTGTKYRALPTNANRWNAYGAIRSFFDGEPLLPA
ncbi:hypothetical protein [Natrinema versiforme]|uniref:Uncharacterized protein n=1 Tax=Natrinema versiforme TaxID=88724 RepID=A0A4P8WM79_9EURY|nr:hypothetical protein [Natrinema versiforme]QCS44678.1 hypothetical protein FEJ81_20465 [Natrinema versiforme]